MTREQCLNIDNLDPKFRTVINRWFWLAEKKGTECKLSSAHTEQEVIDMIKKSFRNRNHTCVNNQINLESMSVDELEQLMIQIPEVIKNKKSQKVKELDQQIKDLQDLREKFVAELQRAENFVCSDNCASRSGSENTKLSRTLFISPVSRLDH